MNTQLQTRPGEGDNTDTDIYAIRTVNLHKAFGSQRVLEGVDMTIPEGSASCILGPSGTGKSVMIKHILGLLRPDAGDVYVQNRSMNEMGRDDILSLRRDIGVMFQDGALFSSMNIYDNVAFPLRQHTDLREPEVHEIVIEHLRAVGLEDALKRMPAELSGGMKKRAGLARSLALDPSILLADEPDSGLDPVRTALLGELLSERHEELGGTVIVVTHNVPLAKLVCDHVNLLWQGKIVMSGAADDVFASADPFVKQFLAGEVAGPLGMD